MSIDYLTNDSFDRAVYRKMDNSKQYNLECMLFNYFCSHSFISFQEFYIIAEKQFGRCGRFKAIEFVNNRLIKKRHGNLLTKVSNLSLTAKGQKHWNNLLNIYLYTTKP
jgi:hypothetical protein